MQPVIFEPEERALGAFLQKSTATKAWSEVVEGRAATIVSKKLRFQSALTRILSSLIRVGSTLLFDQVKVRFEMSISSRAF